MEREWPTSNTVVFSYVFIQKESSLYVDVAPLWLNKLYCFNIYDIIISEYTFVWELKDKDTFNDVSDGLNRVQLYLETKRYKILAH